MFCTFDKFNLSNYGIDYRRTSLEEQSTYRMDQWANFIAIPYDSGCRLCNGFIIFYRYLCYPKLVFNIKNDNWP